MPQQLPASCLQLDRWPAHWMLSAALCISVWRWRCWRLGKTQWTRWRSLWLRASQWRKCVSTDRASLLPELWPATCWSRWKAPCCFPWFITCTLRCKLAENILNCCQFQVPSFIKLAVAKISSGRRHVSRPWRPESTTTEAIAVGSSRQNSASNLPFPVKITRLDGLKFHTAAEKWCPLVLPHAGKVCCGHSWVNILFCIFHGKACFWLVFSALLLQVCLSFSCAPLLSHDQNAMLQHAFAQKGAFSWNHVSRCRNIFACLTFPCIRFQRTNGPAA